MNEQISKIEKQILKEKVNKENLILKNNLGAIMLYHEPSSSYRVKDCGNLQFRTRRTGNIFANKNDDRYLILGTVIVTCEDLVKPLNKTLKKTFEKNVSDFTKLLFSEYMRRNKVFLFKVNNGESPYARFIYKSFDKKTKVDFLNDTDYLYLLERDYTLNGELITDKNNEIFEECILKIDYKFFLEVNLEKWEEKIDEILKIYKRHY